MKILHVAVVWLLRIWLTELNRMFTVVLSCTSNDQSETEEEEEREDTLYSLTYKQVKLAIPSCSWLMKRARLL